MADRILEEDPPEGMRRIGWHCIYHEQKGRFCHNPLDCDLVPIYTYTLDVAFEKFKNAPPRMRNE